MIPRSLNVSTFVRVRFRSENSRLHSIVTTGSAESGSKLVHLIDSKKKSADYSGTPTMTNGAFRIYTLAVIGVELALGHGNQAISIDHKGQLLPR